MGGHLFLQLGKNENGYYQKELAYFLFDCVCCY